MTARFAVPCSLGVVEVSARRAAAAKILHPGCLGSGEAVGDVRGPVAWPLLRGVSTEIGTWNRRTWNRLVPLPVRPCTMVMAMDAGTGMGTEAATAPPRRRATAHPAGWRRSPGRRSWTGRWRRGLGG